MKSIPLSNARELWLSIMILALPIIFFMLTPRDAPPTIALLYGFSAGLIVLDWFPRLVIRYEYDAPNDAMIVHALGGKHLLEQISKRSETITVAGGFRTFGLGLGGLNYGWYQLKNRRCFVVGAALKGELVMIPHRDHWFVITPNISAWRQAV